jgi:glycosyltransferase involved in cell wall biosynthesis
VYNAEKYIEECIESILTQNINICEYEIIAINDGSDDRSQKLLENLKEGNENLKILVTGNEGAGAARNKGINASSGDVITFLDADDFLEPGCIGNLLDIFDKNDLDLLLFETIKVRNRRTIITTSLISGYNEVFTGEDFLPRYLSDFGPCAKLYKRDMFFDNSLFFPEGIIPEDIELIPKLILAANRVMACDIAGYHYNYNPDSVTKKHNRSNYISRIDGLLYVAKSLNTYSLKYSKRNPLVYNYIQKNIINNVILELFYFIECKTHIKREKLKSILNELGSNNLLPLKSDIQIKSKNYLFNHQGIFVFCYFFRTKQIYCETKSVVIRLMKAFKNWCSSIKVTAILP